MGGLSAQPHALIAVAVLLLFSHQRAAESAATAKQQPHAASTGGRHGALASTTTKCKVTLSSNQAATSYRTVVHCSGEDQVAISAHASASVKHYVEYVHNGKAVPKGERSESVSWKRPRSLCWSALMASSFFSTPS